MEIRYKQTYYLTIVMLVFLFASCKKTDTGSNAANWPVVISYLIPGQPISVKVYEQKDIADTSTYGLLIGGLKLSISDGSKTIALSETANGTYTYSDVTYLKAGKTYTLQFTYNSLNVLASTLMPAKPTNYVASRTTINLPSSSPISPTATDAIALTFRWDNPDSLYHVLVFKNDDTSPYNIHPNRNSQVNFTLNAKQAAAYDVYYNTFNYLGTYRAILYSVNKDYIDILTTNANSSSQKLTNPPNTVSNGYGIFTAMQADTIALKLTQY